MKMQLFVNNFSFLYCASVISLLLAAVGAATLHFVQLMLQLCASCSIWCCNSALHSTAGAATMHFMWQLALQLRATCGSSRLNSALLEAVGNETLRFMQQLVLQLCPSCCSWRCNSALHVAVRGWNSALLVAVGTESASCSSWGCTLRFLRHLTLQLCATCVSWGCNSCQSNIPRCTTSAVRAQLCAMRQLALQLCTSCGRALQLWTSCGSGAATLRLMWQLALQLCATCASSRLKLCISYSIWDCNSALHAAVGDATLHYLRQQLFATSRILGMQLCASRGSCPRCWGSFNLFMQQPSLGCNFAFNEAEARKC